MIVRREADARRMAAHIYHSRRTNRLTTKVSLTPAAEL